MTRMRDNPIALSEGATGAPQIQNAAIAASAVHTTELNTTLPAAVTTTTAALGFDMTGGMYVFCPQFKTTSGGIAYGYGYNNAFGTGGNNPSSSSTSYTTRMGIGSNNVSYTASCQWRYVAASPPHDMGDGEIPLFIYALVDSSGEVVATSIAEEPIWLHNGPTIAMPEYKRLGKSYKKIRDITPEIKKLSPKERAAAIKALPLIEIEIMQDLVHADMDIVPHPFTGNDLAGLTPVMLDPVSNTVRELSELREFGEDIGQLLHDGEIKIGNTSLNRVTPAGLLIPSTTWKKTK